MLITTWCGSFVGISTVAFLRPNWDMGSLRLGLYGINASITANVLVGNFFLLNFASGQLMVFLNLSVHPSTDFSKPFLTEQKLLYRISVVLLNLAALLGNYFTSRSGGTITAPDTHVLRGRTQRGGGIIIIPVESGNK